MDMTRKWREIVHRLQPQQSVLEATEDAAPRGAARKAFISAAEALVDSQWRSPLTPFMQQATELNYNIREMHAFLLQHFLGYVDVNHFVLSQRSLMTGEERDMIDLEVTSFMTACAAGVDALKALLQKERLRRMEQEATVRVNTAEGDDGQRGGGALGIELRPGSRPTHEHAAVTFLFERLRAVTEVAETMQNERNKRAAAEKERFYVGPATQSHGPVLESDVGAMVGRAPSAATEGIWAPTSEEVEEERLMENSFSAAYGGSGRELSKVDETAARNHGAPGKVGGSFNAALAPSPQSKSARGGDTHGDSHNRYLNPSTGNERCQAGEGEQISAGADRSISRKEDNTRRNRSVVRDGRMGIGSSARQSQAGTSAAMEFDEKRESPLVSAGALESENRDLVARFQNELDDARMVETKMSEISGLMGLFASKVVEQHEGMEHILDAAVSANDKIERGGQHLEKALERGSSFRYLYTLFMIGASFCLLFLHLYRP